MPDRDAEASGQIAAEVVNPADEWKAICAEVQSLSLRADEVERAVNRADEQK